MIDMRNGTSTDFLSALDFEFTVHGEKEIGNGEDGFLYVLNNNGGAIGVLDGCGGAGAKKYAKFHDKSGAYMASRVVAGATRDWFIDSCKNNDYSFDANKLKAVICDYLCLCKQIGGSTDSIIGTLTKEFPTTAAIIACSSSYDSVIAKVLWAGDSRCYCIDSCGLKQLTADDIDGLDPMENLTADGVMTNVISASKEFCLHNKEFIFSTPCLLLTATDGCFGYYSTPMEFEYLLLSTLISSNTVSEWEELLSNELSEISGDDYSLSGMAFGFGSFNNVRDYYFHRYTDIMQGYISKLKDASQEEKMKLWQSYKLDYLKC